MRRTIRALVVTLGLLTAAGCAKRAPHGDVVASPAAGGGSERLATRGDFAGPAEPGDAPSFADASPTSTAPARDFDEGLSRRAEPRGLGTSYGEQRFSSVVDAPFRRARSTPDVELAVFYNDLDSVRDAARTLASDARGSLESRVTSGDGLVALSVIDDSGRAFPAAQLDGRRYAIGSDGAAYRLGIENHTGGRLEVVASVDGLDVVDGDDAGFHKRGYIVDAFSSVVIDGWRTSGDTVAAFRFSSTADSYADRTGRPRNIGVIGAAFFGEERPDDDAWRRHGADPFPGRFAPPPPARRWR
jgi:hypothetical protein